LENTEALRSPSPINAKKAARKGRLLKAGSCCAITA
jgi:hypothetical protein